MVGPVTVRCVGLVILEGLDLWIKIKKMVMAVEIVRICVGVEENLFVSSPFPLVCLSPSHLHRLSSCEQKPDSRKASRSLGLVLHLGDAAVEQITF